MNSIKFYSTLPGKKPIDVNLPFYLKDDNVFGKTYYKVYYTQGIRIASLHDGQRGWSASEVLIVNVDRVVDTYLHELVQNKSNWSDAKTWIKAGKDCLKRWTDTQLFKP